MFNLLKKIFKKVDKYEYLKQQAKDLRTDIEKNNNKTNAKVEQLRLKMNNLKHQNHVYCNELNNKLIDINSLIRNEQDRIMKDYEGED